MKRIPAIAGAAIAMLALGGCAAMDWGSRLAKFNYTPEDKKDAVVLIAGGSRDYCGPNPTSIRILADGDHSPLNTKGIMGFNSALDTSMYKDHQGVLMAMRLEPGRYYAFPFPLNGTLRVVAVPRADFTVAAGEVVYLGEIYLEAGCNLDNVISFRDEFDRDMAVLKAQNPTLAQTPIQKRILVVTRPRNADAP